MNQLTEEKLLELYNTLENDNITLSHYISNTELERSILKISIKQSLINDINEFLDSDHYNGVRTYNKILEFYSDEINNKSDEQLLVLYNKLYKTNLTLKQFIDKSIEEEKIIISPKERLINKINEYLDSRNYNGKKTINKILKFANDVLINQSEDHLLKLINLMTNANFTKDDFNDKNEMILEIVYTAEDEKYDCDHNSYEQLFNIASARRSYQKHYEEMLERDDFYDDERTNIEELEEHFNKKQEFIKKEFDTIDNQTIKVNNIMQKLNDSPFNWRINFEHLNTKGRKQLFPLLKDFFNKYIDRLSALDKYQIRFYVNDQWITKPLKPETYQKLMNNFTEESFIFDIDNRPPEYFYEKGEDNLPEWSLFSELVFEQLNTSNTYYRDRGGDFFAYLIKNDVPERIKTYLIKLQIFDTLVVNNKQREELNDCCFIYALKQTSCYDDETLNKIRMRTKSRYLSHKAIESLCKEFHFKLKITYIDESRKKRIQSSSKKINYIGDKDATLNRTHVLNIYKEHYFIE